MRAGPNPGVLGNPSNFAMMFIVPVLWDVLKLSWSVEDGTTEFDSGKTDKDFLFQPTRSGLLYTFTVKGCNKALDGSTNFCSPLSDAYTAMAAANTKSLHALLIQSGINTPEMKSVKEIAAPTATSVSIREIMYL
jgi:hypothetical protein